LRYPVDFVEPREVPLKSSFFELRRRANEAAVRNRTMFVS